jgi:hypothetical protein
MEGRTVGEETKGAAVNVAIARWLREETTMPLKWIARTASAAKTS